jgi:hypothetical protein
MDLQKVKVFENEDGSLGGYVNLTPEFLKYVLNNETVDEYGAYDLRIKLRPSDFGDGYYGTVYCISQVKQGTKTRKRSQGKPPTRTQRKRPASEEANPAGQRAQKPRRRKHPPSAASEA